MSGPVPTFHGVYDLARRADSDHVSTQTGDREEKYGILCQLMVGWLFRAEKAEL